MKKEQAIKLAKKWRQEGKSWKEVGEMLQAAGYARSVEANALRMTLIPSARKGSKRDVTCSDPIVASSALLTIQAILSLHAIPAELKMKWVSDAMSAEFQPAQ